MASEQRISVRRTPVERTFAVLKRVFGAERLLVTTEARVRVKMIFAYLRLNLLHLSKIDMVP